MELAREGDKTDVLMIDATHLKAHRTASSLALKKGANPATKSRTCSASWQPVVQDYSAAGMPHQYCASAQGLPFSVQRCRQITQWVKMRSLGMKMSHPR